MASLGASSERRHSGARPPASAGAFWGGSAAGGHRTRLTSRSVNSVMRPREINVVTFVSGVFVGANALALLAAAAVRGAVWMC